MFRVFRSSAFVERLLGLWGVGILVDLVLYS